MIQDEFFLDRIKHNSSQSETRVGCFLGPLFPTTPSFLVSLLSDSMKVPVSIVHKYLGPRQQTKAYLYK